MIEQGWHVVPFWAGYIMGVLSGAGVLFLLAALIPKKA